MSEAFAARWAALREERTSLVLGVQPSPTWLQRWSLRDDVAGASEFCEILLSEAVGRVAAVKVQVPFFERLGRGGLALLARFTDQCRALGTLVVLDTKRCDASDCMGALAATYLGESSRFCGDAMTVVPYMGFESVRPALVAAAERGCAAFVVIRTSDRGSDGVQRARTHDDLTVAESLANRIAATNDALAPDAPIGPVGALIGAHADEAHELLSRIPRSLASLPGLGRPGRTLEQFEQAAADAASRVLLPITSGVLSAGAERLGDRVEGWKSAIRNSSLGGMLVTRPGSH